MNSLSKILVLTSLIVVSISNSLIAEEEDWRVGVGINLFKFSSEGKPKEIDYNKVFDRWERINQNKSKYTVTSYKPLESLYFNFDFGIDIFARYQNKFLAKLSFNLSNPAGIGGKGEIEYKDNKTSKMYRESKDFTYTSKQVALFFGPLITSNNRESEMYMAFSPMPPVWVKYKEKYSKSEDGKIVNSYDKTFRGAFGNCRALIGAHSKSSSDLWVGSEMTYSFLNYMKLTSDDGIVDHSFQFPNMKWNITFRKDIKDYE